MAPNTNDAYRTNDSAGYITPPLIRVVRPLPRRAQRAHEHCSEGECHGGMPARQNQCAAGLSNSAHIPATPFPAFNAPQENQTPLLRSPQSPTSSPPKKRKKIKLPNFLARGKKPTPGAPLKLERVPSNQEPPSSSSKVLSKVTSPHYPPQNHVCLAQPTASHPHPQEVQLQRTIISSPYSARHTSLVDNKIPPSHVQIAGTISQEKERERGNTADRAHLYRYTRCEDMEAYHQPKGGVSEEDGEEVGNSIEGSYPYNTSENGFQDTEYRTEYSSSNSTLESDSTRPYSTKGPRTTSTGLTRPDSFDVGVLSEGATDLHCDVDRLLIRDPIDRKRRTCSEVLEDVHPPHSIETSPESPRALIGFRKLLGKRLEFIKVRTLSDGNGTASLEVVSSSNRKHLGLGFDEGSFFVLKRFKAKRKGVDLGLQLNSMEQLKRECDAYRRIAEAPSDKGRGLSFVMTLEATLTVIDGKSNFEGGNSESLCLVLPLMSKDLGQLMDSSNEDIPLEDVRRIVAQTCKGLSSLHSLGIIHSDVKPANIFLDARGNVKIGDFGLTHTTKKIAALEVDKVYDTANMGTRGFMAPEKVSGRGYSYPVDYWSVGWMLYELVSVGKELVGDLDNDQDLEDWADEHVDVESRKEYFNEEDFDGPTLGLLCGLLDPNPRTRFGIEDISIHPFFKDSAGVSAFTQMHERAMTRTEEAVHDGNTRAAKRIKYVSERSDDTTFRWINPYGGYVSNPSLLA